MKIIGITGQSGAGKGTLSQEFEKLGYIHADADKIYHELLSSSEELKSELVNAFGKEIITNGEIDRKVLGKLVFGKQNERKLLLLNKIAHKYVCREYIKLIVSIKESGDKGLVIDAPLLIEARLHKLCHTNILVTCGKEERINRIIKRDKISKDAALTRINSQKDISFYTPHCDRVFISGVDSESDFARKTDEELNK